MSPSAAGRISPPARRVVVLPAADHRPEHVDVAAQRAGVLGGVPGRQRRLPDPRWSVEEDQPGHGSRPQQAVAGPPVAFLGEARPCVPCILRPNGSRAPHTRRQAVRRVDVAAVPGQRLGGLRSPVVGAILGSVDVRHALDATRQNRAVDLLKYAKVERERRWLLDGLPPFPDDARQVRIVDRYLHGTRLRLREVTETDGTVVRKLGHKVRLGDDAREVACTSLYLDDAEWAALERPPRRRPHEAPRVRPARRAHVALDVFEAPHGAWCSPRSTGATRPSTCRRYAVVREVTDDERFTGALARPAPTGGRPLPPCWRGARRHDRPADPAVDRDGRGVPGRRADRVRRRVRRRPPDPPDASPAAGSPTGSPSWPRPRP